MYFSEKNTRNISDVNFYEIFHFFEKNHQFFKVGHFLFFFLIKKLRFILRLMPLIPKWAEFSFYFLS